MKLKAGCYVPFAERLREEYKINGDQMTANIGTDKIESLMQHFIAVHDEPLFFILELPTQAENEQEIRPGVAEKLHVDVYYLDGCSQAAALTLLKQTGSLLIEDGLSTFGFGGLESGDEILFSKYNIVTIFSQNLQSYAEFFAAHQMRENPNLLTAWDLFDPQHPGVSKTVTVEGKDIYSIPEQLKDWGLYLAQRREEN